MRVLSVVMLVLLALPGHGGELEERAQRYARNPDIALVAAPAQAQFVGTWYSGDHLGVNISIQLAGDNTFSADWTGCLGNYGRASGTWAVRDSRVVLEPVSVDGMFENYHFTFDPVAFKGQIVLVRADVMSVNLFINHPSEVGCFQNTEDLKASVFGPSLFTPLDEPEMIEWLETTNDVTAVQPPN